jgi:hypothetical protein
VIGVVKHTTALTAYFRCVVARRKNASIAASRQVPFRFAPANSRAPASEASEASLYDFQALAEGGSMQAGAALIKEKLWRTLELAPGASPSAPPGG